MIYCSVDPPQSKAPPPQSSGFPEEAGAKKLRILIVEDEVFVRLQAEDFLISEGFDVVASAVSAESAIREAGAHKPDLILMDIRLLGERDGIDAAIEIKQRFGIPSIFVTAYKDAATRTRAAQAEPLGFIDKPYTRETLISTIRSLPIDD